MKKITAMATATLVASTALAADMASQPWVEKRMAELKAELMAEMQGLTPSGGVSRAWVVSNVTDVVTRTDAATRQWTASRIRSSSERTLDRANAYSRLAVTNLVTRDFVGAAFNGELATTNWVVKTATEVARAEAEPFSDRTVDGLLNRSNMDKQTLISTMTNEAYRVVRPIGIYSDLDDKALFSPSEGRWEYWPLGASMTVEDLGGGTNFVFTFSVAGTSVSATSDTVESAYFIDGTNTLLSVFRTKTASDLEISEARGGNR